MKIAKIPKAESKTVEFKKSFNQDTIESLVAFANADGGSVYVGVRDDGKVLGVQLANESETAWVKDGKPTNACYIAFAEGDVPLTLFQTGRFKGADGQPHQYMGHWSWIYFDNNENKCDECGLNEWEWLAMQEMNRLYNPNSGEHFYTAKAAEKDFLVQQGWQFEGTGWVAPGKSETPVYRVYNANGGEHHYTMNEKEKDALVGFGWTYEGIGWYSDDAKGVPLYREYNPNMKACNHNYTANKGEHDYLVSHGWNDEGLAWYGVKVK